jgi:ribosomal protein L23
MNTDFMSLFEKLSPEDRDALIGNFLKNLNGQPTEPILIRKTFKVSNQGTEEEIKQRIADVSGVTVDQLPTMDIKSEFDRNRNNWMRVSEIIAPYEAFLQGQAKTSADKFEELTDIGRFIVAWPDKLRLIVPEKPLEYPDFIIQFLERTVGIEHTRLINPTLKATFNSAKQLITEAETILKNRNLDYKCTVNIFINFSKPVINETNFYNRKFTRKEQKQMSITIADYVQGLLLNQAPEKPIFIEKTVITSSQDSRIDLIIAEDYIAKEGFLELLKARVLAKEAKFDNYISATALDSCWLLVIIDGVSSFSGFDLQEVQKIQTSNKFEKIILFETFSSKIFLL